MQLRIDLTDEYYLALFRKACEIGGTPKRAAEDIIQMALTDEVNKLRLERVMEETRNAD